MTAKELFAYLTQDAGLDDETAKAVMKAAENEKVANRASALKQSEEYDDILAKASLLETSLNGKDGKPGAMAYQKWYEENYAKIQALEKAVTQYTERYGTLEEPKPPAPAPPVKTFTAEEVAAIVDKRISEGYGSRWSNLITQSGTILERHIRSGRKSPLDWKKISELAEAKNGDLNLAYEEWDKPEAEAAAKAAEDKRVEDRVKAELAKRQTAEFFPAGADGGAGRGSASISPLSRAKVTTEPKYDRSKVINAAVTGNYDGSVQ